MPNLVDNVLTVTGSADELRRFKREVRSEDVDVASGRRIPLDFERHVPTPPEALHGRVGAAARAPAKSPNRPGDWDSHVWRTEHWGTKWNAMHPTLRGTLKSGRLIYRFSTAWGVPEPWLDAVAKAHPALTFELKFDVEYGGRGFGRWARGRRVRASERQG